MMPNPLLDAIGAVGTVLDTPGALLRGALAGRPGERASGQDLLTSYGLSSPDDPWGGLKGFGAEAILDPLSLAGPAMGAFKGIQAGTAAARGLAGLERTTPLARRLLELKHGVEDPLGAVRLASRQGESSNPLVRALGGLAGSETGASKPFGWGGEKLAEQVSQDPWFLRSYAGNLTPEKLDPLKTPLRLNSQEIGNVRGIGLHSDPEAMAMELMGGTTRAEHVRDLTHGELPGVGGRMQFDPQMDSNDLAKLWNETFHDSGLNPSLYEANIQPRRVLDLSPEAIGQMYGARGQFTEAFHPLKEMQGEFAQRLWEARQHAARAQGLPWPDVFKGNMPGVELDRLERIGYEPGNMDLLNWIDPYGGAISSGARSPVHHKMASFGSGPNQTIRSLGTLNYDFNSLMQDAPAWLMQQTSSPHVQALLKMGADKDLLREFLRERGFDAILGGEGRLNLLSPEAMRSFERVE